jgi:5-hydroxyisourate hydrolase
MQENTTQQRRVHVLSSHIGTNNTSGQMSQQNLSISSHVLDQNNGKPAPGITVTLQRFDGSKYVHIGEGVTNQDGRVPKDGWKWSPEASTTNGETYMATFQSGEYYAKKQIDTLYPHVPIVFKMSPTGGHYHIPLLLSPFGYSTYRGS